MREVAELADVAISSVSRVLSEHPDVSDEMRTRVLEAVAKLEYEPDFLAQSLRRGETRLVARSPFLSVAKLANATRRS
jgi:LacI family transcriptional regulator